MGIGFLLLLNWSVSPGQAKEQTGFKSQVTFIGDNDVLAFKSTDRYYTNGLFIQYSMLRKNKTNNIHKQIDEWEVGQQIYNAFRRQVNIVDELDRPITGYLFAKFSTTKFKSNNRLWKYGISIGTIGKAALAEQVMQVVHPVLKITTYWNWVYDYQLKNALGVNLHGKYVFSALKNRAGSFQLLPETNVTAGTTFSNISQSISFQLGRFNQMHESEFWQARLSQKSTPTNRKEFFFFYQPKLVYQVYNATLQGGMFRNDKGQIVSDPQPFVLYNTAGIVYSAGWFATGFEYVIQSREAKTQYDSHAYGRVKFAYSFR